MTGRVIAVSGAAGGVGTSTVAAALTVVAATMSGAAGCVDVDEFGGGIDVHFGLDCEPGVRWDDLSGVRGALDPAALVPRLPAVDGAWVLSHSRRERGRPWSPGPPVAERRGLLEVLGHTGRTLVLAAGRAAGDEWWLPDTDLVLLVMGSSAAGLSAASGAVHRLGHKEIRILLTGPAAHPELAGVVAEALDIDVIGCLRRRRGLAADLRRGRPPRIRGRGSLSVALAGVLELAEALPRVRPENRRPASATLAAAVSGGGMP